MTILCVQAGLAQRVVPLRDSIPQYIFSFQEIEYLEDTEGTLTIEEIASADYNGRFTPSPSFSPQNYNRHAPYWYRIRVKHNAFSAHQWQLEFFDQTIDQIDFFVPLSDGGFSKLSMGDNYVFNHRPLRHKNFFIKLPDEAVGIQTYYFRVKSRQQANILLVLRTVDYFTNYALDEYFFFGIFYGMILVFCFYNLLCLAVIRMPPRQ